MICNIVANDYKTMSIGKSLVIDFVNVVRIQYAPGNICKRDTLSDMKHMGESDVKFMRYVEMMGDIVVDSIDSDVLLIAMLYVQQTNFLHNVWVRRYKVKTASDVKESSLGKRKTNTKTKKEYEVVNIASFVHTLHQCASQAIGPEVQIEQSKLTYILVMIFLLTGSDYTRKIPRIGPKSVWDKLHIIIPLATLCVQSISIDTPHEYNIDPQKCTDILFSNLYREMFSKHVHTDEDDYDQVRHDLLESRLSEKVKSEMFNKEQLLCTVTNIQWVISYWKTINTNPDIDAVNGTHGFCVLDGKVRYTD